MKVNEKEIMKRQKEEFEQQLEEARALSKPLHELVVSVNFTVDDVIATSQTTSFTPSSERVIGGESPVYHEGFIFKSVLQVTPDAQDIPVRAINFAGISAVRAGDYIAAQIPRYEERVVYPGFFAKRYIGDDKRYTFFYDRDFKPNEFAIELKILEGGRVLRTERAINYNKFVKE